MGMGVDLNTMYIRKSVKVALDEFPFPTFVCRAYNNRCTVGFREFIVGFCGKIYPVLEVQPKWDQDPVYCYNVEQVDAIVEANFREKQITSYKWRWGSKRQARKRWKFYTDWPDRQRQQDVEKFFNKCAKKQDAYQHLFIENRCPIFVAEYDGSTNMAITYNDELKSLGFVRMFDPYTAFQEIYMYVSNMATPEKPIPEVSDADMVIAKGFDKWSFRKEPGKKRRRK